MNVARVYSNPQGHLELTLTEDTVSYEDFAKWCREFLQRYGGKVVKKIDGPDCRVDIVRLLGKELKLVFRDFPVETYLPAETLESEIVLNAIAELEKNNN